MEGNLRKNKHQIVLVRFELILKKWATTRLQRLLIRDQ